MKKREIKSILENMKNDEEINFYGSDYQGRRIDRVGKHSNDEFSVYSSGQGWCDQVPSGFDLKSTLKIIWSSKPHEALDA